MRDHIASAERMRLNYRMLFNFYFLCNRFALYESELILNPTLSLLKNSR